MPKGFRFSYRYPLAYFKEDFNLLKITAFLVSLHALANPFLTSSQYQQ
jgi:hypothetical protein